MTTTGPPKIDKRKIADLVALIEDSPLAFHRRNVLGLRKHFLPEWRSVDGGAEGRDFGLVLDRLFARLMTILIQHINRIPKKHFAAFLDRVGAERRAGTAARVPVTFVVPPGLSQNLHVRSGTQVATTQSADSRAVLFETIDGFELSGAALSYAAFLDPIRDRWVELTHTLVDPEDKVVHPRLFAPGMDDQRVQHELYLAHDGLLAAGESRDVTVRFVFANAGSFPASVVWQGWDGEDWVRIESPNGGLWPSSAGTLDVTLEGFTGSQPYALQEDEPERAWIRMRIDLAGLVTPDVLPEIQNVFLGIQAPAGQEAIPEEAFANNLPIDLGRDFYPFTERPSQNDAFYIRSSVFQHGDPNIKREVTIQFKLVSIPGIDPATYPTGSAVVEYEYPSRSGVWKTVAVPAVTTVTAEGATVLGDNTAARSFRDGSATRTTFRFKFGIPPDFVMTTVNGSEGPWIRLRIATGDYGHDTRWVEATEDGDPPTIEAANYTPPFLSIADFKLSYRVTGDAAAARPEACRSCNHFEWSEHPTDGSVPFTPIVSLADRREFKPSLWLGYSKPFNGASVSQLLVFGAPNAALRRQEASEDPPQIVWDYLAPSDRDERAHWKHLTVRDDTQALSNSSTIAFTAPADWGPAAGFDLQATWLRARHVGGVMRSPRRLLGVHPNSVWAESTRTFGPDSGGAPIGSGNGERNQRISVSPKPLRVGEVLRVREPNPPAADAVDLLEREEARLASKLDVDPVEVVRAEPDPSGGEDAQWVRWYPILNRRNASPEDRKYVIDRVDGTIEFPGMAVPRGRGNIRFDYYEVDTGERAREAAAVHKVNQLVTSLPFVSEVVNYLPAEGGSAPEQLDDVLDRGPSDLKHRDRAVTREDFEALARIADTGLAIARAYPVTNADGDPELGAVAVLVVPDSLEREPHPSPALADRIRSFLQERASGTAVQRVFVIGPTYTPVSLFVRLVPIDPTQAGTVAARVAGLLETYLHPLRGGRDGRGWGFGAALFISDVYAYIESLEGVDQAVLAEFVGAAEPERVDLADTHLVSAGSIDVEIATRTGGS